MLLGTRTSMLIIDDILEEDDDKMQNLVSINNGQVVVSSRQVAESFGKEHRNVTRDIENLKKDVLNFEQMFNTTYLPDSYGRPQKAYLMNRDGFTLLAMGFTGGKAMEWKLKYIQAFNEMEKQLQTTTALPTSYLDALKALVASEEAKQLAESQVKQLAPKAIVYDDFIDKGHALGFRELAKELHVKESQLRSLLPKVGLAYRQGNKWKPYQESIDNDLMVVKDVINSDTGCTGIQSLFTIKGSDYIRQLFKDLGIEVV